MEKDLDWLKQQVSKYSKTIVGNDSDYLGLKELIDVDLLRELIYEVEKTMAEKEESND